MDDRGDLVDIDNRGGQLLVAGIADEQRHRLRQRGTETGGQVIQHDNRLAGIHQRENHVAADITGAAGDQNGHLNVPVAIVRKARGST